VRRAVARAITGAKKKKKTGEVTKKQKAAKGSSEISMTKAFIRGGGEEL